MHVPAAPPAAGAGGAGEDVAAFLRGVRLPRDADGYITTCAHDDPAAIAAFFAEYGVVVVRDVVPPDEARATELEAWASMGADSDDPATWERWHPMAARTGILGDAPAMSPQACDNRQNPRMHAAFAAVFGRADLIAAVERLGISRATRAVRAGGGEPADRPEWETLRGWLHLDMNPATGRATTFGFRSAAETHMESSEPAEFHTKETNNALRQLKVQGILALVDCPEEVGGFHCVPGFHRVIGEWGRQNHEHCVRANDGMDPTTIQIPSGDPVRGLIERCPIRRGSVLIWDNRVAHANYPNSSARSRVVQYVRMAAADDPAVRPRFVPGVARHEVAMRHRGISGSAAFRPLCLDDFPPFFQFTPLGERVYGIRPWEAGVPTAASRTICTPAACLSALAAAASAAAAWRLWRR